MSRTEQPLTAKSTYGEQLIAQLAARLPTDEYHTTRQPKLLDEHGQSWKPDFIIVCASYGVLIVEVKDWVEIVRADRETVTIRKRGGALERLPNPVETAQHYGYVFADMCRARQELLTVHRQIKKLAFPYHYAVALPNIPRRIIRQIEKAGVWERGVSFSREDLQSPAEFERAIQQLGWRFTLTQRLNSDMLDTIRGVIEPSVKIINDTGQDVGTESRVQSLIIREPLPPPQLPGFADPDSPPVRLVRGVAGSGKTLVLVRRAAYLKAQNPDLRLLVLSFNRDLSDSLARQINDQAIEVMDFHQFCIRITGRMDILSPQQWLRQHAPSLNGHNLSPDFIAEEIAWRKEMELFSDQAYLTAERHGRGTALSTERRQIINRIFNAYLQYQNSQRAASRPWADWNDLPLLALEKLNADSPHAAAYDAILVDEGQDFAPLWIRVIKKALRLNGLLFICDDPTQSLFRSYSWKQKGLDVVGHTRLLRVPFRSTRQISLAAHSLIQADDTLKASGDITAPNFGTYSLPEGDRPRLVRCADAEAEAAFVAAQTQALLENDIAPQQIAILCHDRTQLRQWETLRTQGVYVSSFAKMKGLEFHAVFVPSLHRLFDTEDETAPDAVASQRRRLFTAMTRARILLTLSYQDELPAPLRVLEAHVHCQP